MPSLTEFRFTHPQEQVQFDAIPTLDSVSMTPTVLDLGRSMGTRASVNVTIRDFPYAFGSEPVTQGTFWGKLRARVRSLQGSVLRVIRGEDGQALEDMETEHYVIESLARSAEKVTIVAKDLLKLADDDRAQAPRVSNGRLEDAIDAADSVLTLTPAGIGDDEYPASGKLALGGKEVVSFTRASDVCTITRAQSGTEAVAHDADEVAQLVLEYNAESPADIVYDLLTEYTNIDPTWCDLDAWKDDIDGYVGRLYSAEIAIPTGVQTLVNELIEQVGLVCYWDAAAEQVRLKSLRPVSTSARAVDTDEIMAGSFAFSEQPQKRMSEVWTYYALRNPLAKLDDPQNYASVVATIAEPDADLPDQPAAIKKIFSRWITAANRTAASRLNDMLIARYADAPRSLKFGLYRTSTQPELAQGLLLSHWVLQDADGLPEPVPCQITSINKSDDSYDCVAEEMLFTDDGSARLVVIDADAYEINLRELYDEVYLPPEEYDEITFVVEDGIFVGVELWTLGGVVTSTRRAITVGDWPEGPIIRLINNGFVSGGGGSGKDARVVLGFGGACGSHALYTRYPIIVENYGTIAGGGGGGGRGSTGGGGGGAGRTLGVASVGTGYAQGGPNSSWAGGTSNIGANGLATTGGAAGDANGGAGGNLGEDGADGSGGPGSTSAGGPAGYAVDGHSLVTYDNVGTILGPQVN